MTETERFILEVIRNQGKVSAEVIDRAHKLEQPYLAATLDPRHHSVEPEAVAACVREFPEALSECGSAGWFAGLIRALARGYAGRQGIGVDDAIVYTLSELLVVGHMNPQIGLEENDFAQTVAFLGDIRAQELARN